uniref:Uncharacterized protein n=1 Tax=Cucumis melo TaxID=3656 RepID=A0A9I9E3X3_CUCME
ESSRRTPRISYARRAVSAAVARSRVSVTFARRRTDQAEPPHAAPASVPPTSSRL